MDGALGTILGTLTQSGPLGAILAAVVIALVLAVIIFAHTKDLWSGSKQTGQVVGFQDRLLTMVDKLTASEEAMRKRVDELSRDREVKQQTIDELRAHLSLLRVQRSRLIAYLRDASGRPERVR